jgi:hypothetical protein
MITRRVARPGECLLKTAFPSGLQTSNTFRTIIADCLLSACERRLGMTNGNLQWMPSLRHLPLMAFFFAWISYPTELSSQTPTVLEPIATFDIPSFEGYALAGIRVRPDRYFFFGKGRAGCRLVETDREGVLRSITSLPPCISLDLMNATRGYVLLQDKPQPVLAEFSVGRDTGGLVGTAVAGKYLSRVVCLSAATYVVGIDTVVKIGPNLQAMSIPVRAGNPMSLLQHSNGNSLMILNQMEATLTAVDLAAFSVGNAQPLRSTRSLVSTTDAANPGVHTLPIFASAMSQENRLLVALSPYRAEHGVPLEEFSLSGTRTREFLLKLPPARHPDKATVSRIAISQLETDGSRLIAGSTASRAVVVYSLPGNRLVAGGAR